jgi:hypothetical protein
MHRDHSHAKHHRCSLYRRHFTHSVLVGEFQDPLSCAAPAAFASVSTKCAVNKRFPRAAEASRYAAQAASFGNSFWKPGATRGKPDRRVRSYRQPWPSPFLYSASRHRVMRVASTFDRLFCLTLMNGPRDHQSACLKGTNRRHRRLSVLSFVESRFQIRAAFETSSCLPASGSASRHRLRWSG